MWEIRIPHADFDICMGSLWMFRSAPIFTVRGCSPATSSSDPSEAASTRDLIPRGRQAGCGVASHDGRQTNSGVGLESVKGTGVRLFVGHSFGSLINTRAKERIGSRSNECDVVGSPKPRGPAGPCRRPLPLSRGGGRFARPRAVGAAAAGVGRQRRGLGQRGQHGRHVPAAGHILPCLHVGPDEAGVSA